MSVTFFSFMWPLSKFLMLISWILHPRIGFYDWVANFMKKPFFDTSDKMALHHRYTIVLYVIDVDCRRTRQQDKQFLSNIACTFRNWLLSVVRESHGFFPDDRKPRESNYIWYDMCIFSSITVLTFLPEIKAPTLDQDLSN